MERVLAAGFREGCGMAKAYIVDAVRTPVGRRGGGRPAVTSSAPCSRALTDLAITNWLPILAPWVGRGKSAFLQGRDVV